MTKTSAMLEGMKKKCYISLCFLFFLESYHVKFFHCLEKLKRKLVLR